MSKGTKGKSFKRFANGEDEIKIDEFCVASKPVYCGTEVSKHT